MLTTCPNCLHVFQNANNNNNNNPQHRQQYTSSLPSSSSTSAVHFASPCCESNRQHQQQPLLVSLQLPPTSVPTTCTVSVSTTTGCQQHLNNGLSFNQGVLARMAGGGIIVTNNPNPNNNVVENPSSVILQQSIQDEKVVLPPCSPQPSPSTPLSFILPSAPTVFTTTARTSTLPAPFQWAVPTTTTTSIIQPHQQWAFPSPNTTPWVLGLQVPSSEPIPQVPQSDTDLLRIAATLKALRTSGWYYEGLSWQESAEALQSTSPGTFLVRDSSDPRFLFSLSVQTERGPTSVRLHYVCGQFRLDAEPRLAPLMPLFECVVRLVEYYIEATKDSARTAASEGENHMKGSKGNHHRQKEQVWVDARGHMYSHILLTTPLYKKQQLPSLQHLARLAINKSLRAAVPQNPRSPQSSPPILASQLPLPPPLVNYLQDYPYTH